MAAGNNFSRSAVICTGGALRRVSIEDIRGIPVAGERLRDEAAAGAGNPLLRLRLSQGISTGYPLPGEMSAADEQSLPLPAPARARAVAPRAAVARGYGANINQNGRAVSLFNNTKN